MVFLPRMFGPSWKQRVFHINHCPINGVHRFETHPWDPVERLSTLEAHEAYLEAAFEEGDPDLIVAAIGDIARAWHE